MNSDPQNAVVTRESITLRPVKPEDEVFLLEVYAGTRANELALVPWNEEQKQAFVRMQFDAQQEHYQKYSSNGKHEIVLCGDRPVGRLWLDRKDDQIIILDLTILPSDRNHGIGSDLLRRLLKEAETAHKSVSVYVETFSLSLPLFERLGFEQVATEGINYLLKWSPP
ncbi:MAG: GNAT family N-acetyltransferase [Acidobacteriota bacterium]